MSESKVVVPELDNKKVEREIVQFIKKIVKEAKVNGIVLGLSGGVDSSLVAVLCVNALGKDRVLGIILPVNFTPKKDIQDARELAKKLGIATLTIDLEDLYQSFIQTLKFNKKVKKDKIPLANALARIRMTILYFYANLRRLLVAGTSDRSEILLGFFTKYGDGGADFLPIAHLYKTQVRKLAEHVNVPRKIAYKPSSPRLYPGHKATDELPLDYEQLDPVLVGLFDENLSNNEITRLTNVPLSIIKEVKRRFNISKHKRAFPPMLKPPMQRD